MGTASIRSPQFLALVLFSGLALLLAPAITAIPPYVALDYLAVGGICIASVLLLVLGPRVRDLPAMVAAMSRLKIRTPRGSR